MPAQLFLQNQRLSLKKLARRLSHAAGWNCMSPTSLKMIWKIKLHLLQGDNLLACQKERKEKYTTQVYSKYEKMKAYDTFLTPDKLKAFEEGVFNKEQTWLFLLGKMHSSILSLISNSAESNWDPQELWIPWCYIFFIGGTKNHTWPSKLIHWCHQFNHQFPGSSVTQNICPVSSRRNRKNSSILARSSASSTQESLTMLSISLKIISLHLPMLAKYTLAMVAIVYRQESLPSDLHVQWHISFTMPNSRSKHAR
ncbi:hypothetical protein VP01_879g5 [Puccinia sorghi]|uniref:Uncharacterized protein n=1 Tax=Puccinia sorghi TaxID=27349 RepID=A0A0L6U8E8_9BASI|nr:hypothetical protein VP01_879g5 [Puccinia sorghi]